MQRRNLLRNMGATGGLSLMSTLYASDFTASRLGPNYSRFRGTKVVMSIPAHPHYFAMMKLLPLFTKETGIRVEVDRLDIKNIKSKQISELEKSDGDFDLISYVVMWKTEYVQKKLLLNLEPFFNNSKLMHPEYDLEDIVSIYLENIGLVGGPKGYLKGTGAKLYGLPYGAETSVLAYRRDVFEQLKLKPPQTYDQLTKLLPIINDKARFGAMTSRGLKGHQCVHAWLLHLNPLGGSVFDANWRPTFADSAAIKALETLQLIVDTGPKDIPFFDQGDMIASFLRGQASMYLDSSLIFSLIEQNANSKFAQNVGYALHPMGIKNASEAGGLGLAIAKNSKNPEAAFLLLQWLTSKKQDQMVCHLGGVPTRWSTLSEPTMLRRFPQFSLLKEQLKYANPDWRPIIAQWDEINVDFLGKAIYSAITKREGSRQALLKVLPSVQEIMIQSGYQSQQT